ncbi:uncharacterized protein LOC135360200 [Latimeria chalumnae]|uniref:uncharacterized protein LOC135360200 n=1 Tax=Latimeria chalumnae TaxID=7897 RepID=UPI00313CE8D9
MVKDTSIVPEQVFYEVDREKETLVEATALRPDNEVKEAGLITSEQGLGMSSEAFELAKDQGVVVAKAQERKLQGLEQGCIENIPLKSVEIDVWCNPSKGTLQWENPSSGGPTLEVVELPPGDPSVFLQKEGMTLSRQEPAHIVTIQGSLTQEMLESSSTPMPSKEAESVAPCKGDPDNLGNMSLEPSTENPNVNGSNENGDEIYPGRSLSVIEKVAFLEPRAHVVLTDCPKNGTHSSANVKVTEQSRGTPSILEPVLVSSTSDANSGKETSTAASEVHAEGVLVPSAKVLENINSGNVEMLAVPCDIYSPTYQNAGYESVLNLFQKEYEIKKRRWSFGLFLDRHHCDKASGVAKDSLKIVEENWCLFFSSTQQREIPGVGKCYLAVCSESVESCQFDFNGYFIKELKEKSRPTVGGHKFRIWKGKTQTVAVKKVWRQNLRVLWKGKKPNEGPCMEKAWPISKSHCNKGLSSQQMAVCWRCSLGS